MTPSQEDSLGQLLLLKVNELRWDSSFEHFLRHLLPGGILLGALFAHGAELTREFLIKLARALPAVPFLAIEEEGGTLDPLRAFFPPLPAPRSAAEKGLAAVSRLGGLVGAALQFLGFNCDLAPVLDLASPASEKRSCEAVQSSGRDKPWRGRGMPPCGPKPPGGGPWRAPTGISSQVQATDAGAFSSNPREVAKCGAAFLEGLERHNLRACGKHFPGLETALYVEAPERATVSKSMAQLWREDLVPYRALLPRLPLVLVSPAAYKAYDFDLLQSAALSPEVVEGLLRVKLGYNGVAIACGLETEAVRGKLALEEAAVQALRAGCDMLLLEKTEAAERVQRALSAARESGELPTPRVEQALKRLQLAKQGLKPPHGPLSRRSLAGVVREFTDFSSDFAG
jgi:beta-N-acetylhexosaminidase